MSKINCKIYSIDGNIGAGKTTVLKQLQKTVSNILIICEPIEEWESLIEKANDNPKLYAFKVQNIILNHFEKIKNNLTKLSKQYERIIVERSAVSSVKVFAKQYLTTQAISKAEYSQLMKRLESIHIDYDLRIYINTKPTICLERILLRSRSFELKQIKLKYLLHLEALYKDIYFNDYKKKIKIIDGNQSKNQVLTEILTIINIK